MSRGGHGHEENRIGLRGVIIFTIALFGAVGIVESVSRPGDEAVRGNQEAGRGRDPGRMPSTSTQFPTPSTAAEPHAELAEMKEEERSRINGYGWVDRKAGIAHIPVERAMDILARTGLPKVAAPAPVPGAPPNTSIPPGRKRDDRGDPKRSRAGSHETRTIRYPVTALMILVGWVLPRAAQEN